MAVDERLDLKLSAADKQLFAQAAAIEGLSMAAFVRSAAKRRAAPFAPNPALQAALNDAANRVNRV